MKISSAIFCLNLALFSPSPGVCCGSVRTAHAEEPTTSLHWAILSSWTECTHSIALEHATRHVEAVLLECIELEICGS